MSAEGPSSSLVECPICGKKFLSSVIENHAEECLDKSNEQNDIFITDTLQSPASTKKHKLDFSSSKSNFFFKRTRKESNSCDIGNECSSDGAKPDLLFSSPTANKNDKSSLSFVAMSSTAVSKEELDSFEIFEKKRNLFGEGRSSTPAHKKNVPLAERMRPTELVNYVGQEKILGHGTMLRNLIESLEIPSMILWGPPGCGKTTLAHIIANACKKNRNARFVTMSATTSGVGDVKEIINIAKTEKKMFQRTTILFMDEIHRFNKLQQDTFLPHVENGTVILIGATTENPSFSLNNALLSRCKVFVLDKLSEIEVENILQKTFDKLNIHYIDNGHCNEELPDESIQIDKGAVKTLASLCDGDARAALNALQMAVQSQLSLCNEVSECEKSTITINEKNILEGFQRSHLLYDKAGDEHYNCISALHKSLRGSDANASLYWLARMLMGGEDPLYVARRMIRFASEDIGLADPAALQHAVTAYQACQFIGLPECKVNLAQVVVYLARAPKSIEIYEAYLSAEKCIKNHNGPLPGVPLHLRNAPTKLMKNLGYGKDYKYNPKYNYEVKQKYFPDEMKEIDFFSKKPSS